MIPLQTPIITTGDSLRIIRAEATVGGETITATAYLHGTTGDGSLVISDGRGEQLVTHNLRRLAALAAALQDMMKQIEGGQE